MNESAPALLDQIASSQFAEASLQLEILQQDALAGSIPADDLLALLRKARYMALAQRSHLIKSLALLEASQLFTREKEQRDPTWSLEA
jgi:hypothetical protein